MTPTTETARQNELTLGHLGVYVIVGILVILYVVLMRNRSFGLEFWDNSMTVVLIPWHLASWKTIENGLQEFSGSPLVPTPEWGIAFALIGIIVLGVLLPTLLVYALRLQSRDDVRNARSWPRDAKDAFTHIIFTISLVLAMALCGSVIVQKMSFEKLKRTQAIESAKDGMIIDLTMIAIQARQHRILPKRLGGGEGSYTGFALTPEITRTAQATYAMVVERTRVMIKAVSLDYPASTIMVDVDPSGALSGWTYAGEFE